MPKIHSALKLIFPNSYKEDSQLGNQRVPLHPRWSSQLLENNTCSESGHLGRTCRENQTKAAKETYITPLKQRIRAKIEERRNARLGQISTTLSSPHSGSKASPISVNSSSDDSSADEGSSDKTSSAAVSPSRMAPGPETYTKAEIKKFDRVTKTIGKVNDGLIAKHSAATAEFIDAEFSNNTGRARRAWAAKSPWKQERLKQACSQAARIMEERLVHAQHALHHAPRTPSKSNPS